MERKKFDFEEHQEKLRLLGELQQSISLDLVTPNKELPENKIVFWHIPTIRKNLNRFCEIMHGVGKFEALAIAVTVDFFTQEFVEETVLIQAIKAQGGDGKKELQMYDALFD